MTCSLCESRKAKRFCPALREEICAQCCGKEREETLNCPLDCPYLLESRAHERRPGLDPDSFPYKEIRIRESFLRDHEDLLAAGARFLYLAALQAPGPVDQDVREALDALARTYKSLASGVYYQTMPPSPVAQSIVSAFQQMLQQYRREQAERTGVTHVRDADVLGVLVFLLRMALDEDNGRRYCKRFLHTLHWHFAPELSPSARSSLIVPG
jgi:hypothetical protein